MAARPSAVWPGLIEAAWLAAIVSLPLYFNKYAANSFEPEKIYLTRTLVLVVAGAWLLEICLTHGRKSSATASSSLPLLMKLPAVRAMLGSAAAMLIATATSIEPLTSLQGTVTRGMGAYTAISAFVLCAAIAVHLVSDEQLQRLVTIVIMVSVPVCFYGLAQRAGIEPIVVTARFFDSLRVTSTFGNPVFLAAYLVLIAPLALGRALECFCMALAPSIYRRSTRLAGWLYGSVFVMVLVVIVLSGSRGATIGLVAGLLTMGLALNALARARRVIASRPKTALVVIVLFVVAAVGVLPRVVPRVPALERFTRIADFKSGAGLQRSTLWQMASQTITAREPLEIGRTQSDRWHRLRLAFGYGAETVPLVVRRYMSPALIAEYEGRYLVPDRVHSDSWDTLLTGGLLGLAMRELLLACVYWQALRCLRRAGDSRPWLFAAYLGGGAAAGAIAIVSWQSTAFVMLGLRLGVIAGLVLYLLRSSGPPMSADDGARFKRRVLAAALLGAFVAHAVESAFSFPTSATVFYFWIYVGTICAMSQLSWRQESGVPPPSGRIGEERSRRTVTTAARNASHATAGADGRLADGIVIGALIALVFVDLGFTWLSKGDAVDALTVVIRSVALLPGTGQVRSPAILVLLVGTWLLSLLLVVSDADRHGRNRPVQAVALTSTALVTLFWLLLATSLAGIRPWSPGDRLFPERLTHGVEAVVALSQACTALVVGVVALALSRRDTERVGAGQAAGALLLDASLVTAVVILAGCGAWLPNQRWSYAAVAAARTEQFKARNEWATAQLSASQLVAALPRSDHYRLLTDNLAVLQALRTADTRERRDRLAAARESLIMGYRDWPLNTGFAANLADVYINEALAEQDESVRSALASRAAELCEEVLRMEPARFEYWNKWAYLDLRFFRRPDAAADKLRRATAIVPNAHESLALTADVDAFRARLSADGNERRQFYKGAIEHYEQAIAHAGAPYTYRCALGAVYGESGDVAHAIDAYSKCRADAPPSAHVSIDEIVTRLRGTVTRVGDAGW